MTDIKKFFILSKKIGDNYSLIQGPGGNTSYKEGSQITIKKSGAFLKDAINEEIFINEEIKLLDTFYGNEKNNKKFSKEMSIETPLHIIFEEKYVFHYHSLLSIIISSCFMTQKIKNICQKLNMTWIPYKRPGVELAQEVGSRMSKNKIFFLQNHGMLIGSNDIDGVSKTIDKTEKGFLDILGINETFYSTSLKFKGLSKEGLHQYEVSNVEDLSKLKIINNKFLFPDHAVFGNYKYIEKSLVQEYTGNEMYFQNNTIFTKNKLTQAEIEILRSVLIIINHTKEVLNYISKEVASDLITSEDEQYRINKNK